MNSRERYVHHMTFQPVDRPPFMLLMGAWPETLARWRDEGMPPGKDVQTDLADRFGLEDFCRDPLGVNLGMCPAFEEEVLAEDEDSKVIRNAGGVICRIARDATAAPMFLDFPVKSRDDWKRIVAERFDPDSAGRFPCHWEQIVEERSQAPRCVSVGGRQCGVFGTVRELVGYMQLFYMLYDDPGLVREMMEHLTGFWLKLSGRIVERLSVDLFYLWEDMAYRNGPLISPDAFTEFMAPCYRRISRFCRDHGIPLLSVDSDGDMRQLVPLMLDAGVNEIYPFEVQAGSDVNAYRAAYPRLAMWGGLDKRALAAGRKAIDAELDRVAPLAWRGGYVVNPDHSVPPDVPYADFLYYVEQLGSRMGAL